MVAPARRFALAAFLALAIAIAGCSVTRVAYSNAPPAIAWMVDDWFDLQDGQKDWVKERAARLVAWHRASELPEYERFLQEIAARVARGIREEDARWAYLGARDLYRRAMEKMLPDIADFLAQVTPEQVAYLERKFDKDNEKSFAEAGATPKERAEKRVKRFVERLEDWTGRLTPAQRELVAARVKAMPDVTDDWLLDRQKRQGEFVKLLRARPPREAMIAGVRRLLLDTDAWRSPAYVAKLRQRDEQSFALLAALDATFDAAQRASIRKKVIGYAADVAYLMAPR